MSDRKSIADEYRTTEELAGEFRSRVDLFRFFFFMFGDFDFMRQIVHAIAKVVVAQRVASWRASGETAERYSERQGWSVTRSVPFTRVGTRHVLALSAAT
jgi:hypothetical protein